MKNILLALISFLLLIRFVYPEEKDEETAPARLLQSGSSPEDGLLIESGQVYHFNGSKAKTVNGTGFIGNYRINLLAGVPG